MLINIKITDKHPTVEGAPIIVCGNSDYRVLFEFDEEWDAHHTKTARFVYVQDGAVKYQDVVFTGDMAAVPVMSNTAEVFIGVYTGDICTSTPARIPCERSIRCGTGAPADPVPSQYDQIIALLNAGGGGGEGDNSVTKFGAKGDGETDDTAAFTDALANQRRVYVPGGTYKLSSGIVIRDNCELELAQDAVLNFTNTSGNCITLNMSSSLKGNHATVNVPYKFDGNVIYADTTTTTSTNTVPPFIKWSPQWKSGRYVTDLNICKADSRGFHYSVDGDTYGTAVYISANGDKGGNELALTFMWGVHYSGLRIAGGFKYGIRAVNFNNGWNHEMRIDAFIDACEIGVSLEDCNNAYVSAIVQPRRAYSEANVYSPYAKHGIELIRSRNTDLSGSRVWDWTTPDNPNTPGNEKTTLWEVGNEYQHIAMKGNCNGTILNDFLYYESAIDIRDLIYTDTPSNLEKINILQEPFTRWFKPKDGEPYFSDGFNEKKLATEEDIDRFFTTDKVPTFTDVLATAIDSDGTVFKGKGYTTAGYIQSDGTFLDEALYTGCTGFIPIKDGDILYAEDLKFATGTNDERIVLYDSNFAFLRLVNQGLILNPNDNGIIKYTELANGFALNVRNTPNCAYIRITLQKAGFGVKPYVAINEEIGFTEEGFLVDSVKVKAENVIGSSGGGGAQSDWNASEGEAGHVLNRTHYIDGTKAATLLDTSVTVASNQFMSLGIVPIELGKTYTVTWDGTEYECVAFESNAMGAPYPALGNPYFSGLENNGMPFGFISAEDQMGFGGAAMTNGAHTIKITEEVPNYKPLDVEYLPLGSRTCVLTLPEGALGKSPFLSGEYTISSISYDLFADILWHGGDLLVDFSKCFPTYPLSLRLKQVSWFFAVEDGVGMFVVFFKLECSDDGDSNIALIFTNGTWTPPTT